MGWLLTPLGLLASLGGFLFLLGAYFVLTSRSKARWLGALAIVASAPFFYWLGAFREQFNNGQCYSSVVGHIANAVERTSDPKSLGAAIRSHPMEGYETNCSSVEKESGKLPYAANPK
jgi:hypothetical protein